MTLRLGLMRDNVVNHRGALSLRKHFLRIDYRYPDDADRSACLRLQLLPDARC